MSMLPVTSKLRLEHEGAVLTVWLDDPVTRNALTAAMRDDLMALVDWLEGEAPCRLLVLRGSGRTFCSGADLKAFRLSTDGVASGTPDPIAEDNRRYGAFLQRFNALPLVTIALVEGAAFAGALGLLSVTDTVIVLEDARFSMSETTLGLVPAQIAPFVIQRIGLTQTRRLALTGLRFTGAEAVRIGIAHDVCADLATAEDRLAHYVADALRCAPDANARTKRLLLKAAAQPADTLLDAAADLFAQALRGTEGQEGVTAFAEKRKPVWAGRGL